MTEIRAARIGDPRLAVEGRQHEGDFVDRLRKIESKLA